MAMLSVYDHLARSHAQSNPIDALLTPSWLSGLVCVVASVALVLVTLSLFYYRGSSLNNLVIDQQQQASAQAITPDYAEVNNSFGSHAIISDIPLFIFWAGIGAIVYAFVSAIIGAFRSIAELRKDMEYVNASRQELVKWEVERAAIRLVALVLWVIFLNYTLHFVYPYAAALSYAGSAAGNWLFELLFILGSVLVLGVCGHLHVIFLRLIAIRPRLLG